jgi:hypothetical protein
MDTNFETPQKGNSREKLGSLNIEFYSAKKSSPKDSNNKHHRIKTGNLDFTVHCPRWLGLLKVNSTIKRTMLKIDITKE